MAGIRAIHCHAGCASALRAHFRLFDLHDCLQCRTCRPLQPTSAAPRRTPNGQACALHRRSHRWPHVPHRSRTNQSGPLARSRGSHSRRPDGDDAVLRADGQRSRPPGQRLADAGAQDLTGRIDRGLICEPVLPTLPAGIRRSVVAAACLAAILIAGCSAVAAAAPRVRLVATGGTIGNARYGRWNADALAASAPNLSEIARVETETFARGPSLALSLEDWVRLARRLNQIAADADLDGIVVTSGTDSLEEVAWFLDLTVRTPKPVVVTGAMRKPGEADSDGPANLEDAVRLAASPAARGRGTLVMFHGLVLSARDVEKASTVKVEAFDAGAHHPLGRVSAGVVTLTAENPRRHAMTSEFDIGQIARLPRVDVLLTYQGAPGDLAEAAIAKGARGLVMAAAGAG